MRDLLRRNRAPGKLRYLGGGAPVDKVPTLHAGVDLTPASLAHDVRAALAA